MQQTYPDISGILSAKARRRSALAALSWEEKVAIIEQMQRLLPKGRWRDHSLDESVSSRSHADQSWAATDAASQQQE